MAIPVDAAFFVFKALTRTQMKILLTVVIIISLIMLVIALFRFR